MQPHPYGHPNADSHQQQAQQHTQSQHQQQQQSQQQYPFAYPYHQPQYPPPYGAFPQAQAPPPPLGPGSGTTPYQAYMQPYHQHQHQQHGYYQQAGSYPTHPYQQQMNPYSHQLNNQNSQYPQQQHFQQRQQYNHGQRHHQGQHYSNNNNNSNSNNPRQYQNNNHSRNPNNRHNHSQRFRHHNNHHNQRRHNNYQSQQSGRRMSKPPPSQQTPDNILARLLLDHFSNSKNSAVPSATFLNRLRQACLNTFLTLSEQNSASIPSFSILESLHHLILSQKTASAICRPNSTTTTDVSESAPTNDEGSEKNDDKDNNQSTKKMKVMSKSDIVSELSLDFILLCTSTPATWIYATCSGSVCNLLSITILSMFTSTTPQTDFSLGLTHFDQLVSRLQSFSDVNFWERRTFLTVKPVTPFVLSIRAAISSDEKASIQVDHLQCLVKKTSLTHWLGVPDNVIILILQALRSSSKTLPQNVAQVLLQRLEFIPPPHDLASRLKSWLSKEVSGKTGENDNQPDSENMAEDGKAGSGQKANSKIEAGVETEVDVKTEVVVKTDDVSDGQKNNCESSELAIVEGERQIESAILNTICRIRELSECLHHRPITVSNKDGSDKSEESNQLEEAISKYPEVAVTKLGYMESACITVLTGLSDTSVRYHHQTLSVLRTLLSAVSTTLSLIENTDEISVDSDLILQGLTFLTEENRKVNGVPALFAPVAVPLCHIICSTARTIQPVSEVKKILQCVLSGRTTCAEVKNAAKKALSLIKDNERKAKDEDAVQQPSTDGSVVCKKDEAKIEEMNDNSGDGDNDDGGANGDVGKGGDGGGGDVVVDGGDDGDDVENDTEEQLKDEGDTTVLQDDKEVEDDATRSDDNDDEEDSMKEKDR